MLIIDTASNVCVHENVTNLEGVSIVGSVTHRLSQKNWTSSCRITEL